MEETAAFVASWCVLLCLAVSECVAVQPADEDLLQMVAELLTSPDRDTRGLGLQQVREGLPGEAITRRLADLLPKLAPPGQAALLEALSERDDGAARPAVLKAVASPDETVRVAALHALSALGEPSDVVLLAEKAARGSAQEKQPARQSLARLRGQKITATILDAMTKAAPAVRVELLGALAARKATDAVPVLLRSAADPDRSVRLAALTAAKSLAGAKETAALIQLLGSTREEAERNAAEVALLAVCGRNGQACADTLLVKLASADVPTRLALLRALAVIGGPRALEAITGCWGDSDPSLRDETLRILSDWPESAAAPHLMKIARETDNPAHHILALRGVIRLASPVEERPANLEMLNEAWQLANRPEEKRLMLGALGGMATPAALEIALEALASPKLRDEAALAVVMIAEKLPAANTNEVLAAMQKVLQCAQEPSLRQRAERTVRNFDRPRRD
ncbi:MAG: HEAT repeat domain-containing protein [Chloroflexi bacterium]|nr:HEAT repeat domain-containing protein [Chloroflexota bacterium]